jgi:hypothetical protein
MLHAVYLSRQPFPDIAAAVPGSVAHKNAAKVNSDNGNHGFPSVMLNIHAGTRRRKIISCMQFPF